MLTIGIPTYNRSAFLRTSLASALGQTSSEVKIIVSDNASTDDTEAVVSEFGGRIRYERARTNLGPKSNFIRLLELCDTEYFSWLQDDDCLDHRFAERALCAFRANPAVTTYSAFALMSEGMESHYKAQVFGPSFSADFLTGKGVQTVDGRLVTPFSLFMSVTFPPVAVFRTETLRALLRSRSEVTDLFGERTWGAHSAAIGLLAVDPFIGAIVRLHPGQSQFSMLHREEKEWLIMAQDLDQLAASWNPDWLDGFAEALTKNETVHRQTWLRMSESWPRDLAICRKVTQALKDSLPGYSRRSEPPLKVLLRNITPPLLWNGIGAAKSMFSGR